MDQVERIVSVTMISALLTVPSSAHVLLDNKEAAVGGSVKAVFVVPHGCSGFDTTRLRVKIPEGVIAVEPEAKSGWTIETVKGKYAAVYDYQGAKVGEGVQEVSWSGGRVPDKTRDTFPLDLYLTDSLKPDSMLYFPVVQECEQGVSRWIEIPAEGSDPHDYKRPAPGIKLVPRS